ncbi:hypothetical protein SESBI_16320 [Sesbania bispinosa]|nr:hypothetical protein SESBI_16320 [Sesbania bispinosa]
MAPKREKTRGASSSGTARRKRATPSQTTQELLEIPEDRFLSKEHEERFNKNIICRDIIREMGITNEYPEIQEEIERRGWQQLVATPLEGCKVLTKEFYPNAFLPKKKAPLNIFLMSGVFPSHTHPTSSTGPWGTNKPRAIWRTSLKPIPRVWATFVMSKLLPVSNKFEIPVERSLLIYCIMTGTHIDVGRLIAHNIYKLANSPKFKLGYPHLITQIIADQSVPRVPIERIRPEKSIDAKYIQAVFDEIPEEFVPPIKHVPTPALAPATTVTSSKQAKLTTHAMQSLLKNQQTIYSVMTTIARSLNIPQEQLTQMKPFDDLDKQFLNLDGASEQSGTEGAESSEETGSSEEEESEDGSGDEG